MQQIAAAAASRLAYDNPLVLLIFIMNQVHKNVEPQFLEKSSEQLVLEMRLKKIEKWGKVSNQPKPPPPLESKGAVHFELARFFISA